VVDRRRSAGWKAQRCWFVRGCSPEQSANLSPDAERDGALPRRTPIESQTGLPFARQPSQERTLEVGCGNCAARFIAWYGEDDAEPQTKDVEKCGICGGDPTKRDIFKDSILRLIPQVTARNIKRHAFHPAREGPAEEEGQCRPKTRLWCAGTFEEVLNQRNLTTSSSRRPSLTITRRCLKRSCKRQTLGRDRPYRLCRPPFHHRGHGGQRAPAFGRRHRIPAGSSCASTFWTNM
jgi:hypothetical protein